MALRSSLSGLRNFEDIPNDGGADEAQEAVTPAPVQRGRLVSPAREEAPVAPSVARRGRPRLSEEEKAERAAARKQRKPRTSAPKPANGGTTIRALRASIKQAENDLAAIKAQVAAATAKFQPKINELSALHSQLNAELREALLK